MTKFIKEFKDFAVKGNAIDLAIGVIIGGAFGKIISSLVTDIIMPPVGLLLGGVNFSDIQIVLKAAVKSASGTILAPAVSINIGLFLQNILDFLIIAVVIFIMVKMIMHLKGEIKSTDDKSAALLPPTKDQELLQEIRDLLKDRPRL